MKNPSSTPQEVELKLEVAPSELEKVLAHPPLNERSEGSKKQTLHSTYFDTPDHVLKQAGISFRIRRSGDQRIQTIKAARSAESIALARSEWEHEVESNEPNYTVVEGIGLKPFCKHRDTIQPVFSVTTERTLHTVSFGSSIIEVAVDASKINAKERRVSFGELELELKDGTSSDLFRLALALSEAASLRLSFKAKADRGFEAISGEQSTRIKAPPFALKRKMTNAVAFQIIGSSCLQHLMDNEAIVRRAPEPDAVHQMRVALRRLRTAITLFKRVVEDERRDPIRAELKWMANVLGEARDLDVYITKVLEPARDQFRDDEGYQNLLAEYQKRRSQAYQRVQDTIASPRFIRGVLETAAWTQVGDWLLNTRKPDRKRGDQPVAELAEQQLGQRWKKILKRGKNLAELDPKERHLVRIEIKKLRYATEFFESLFKGGGAKKRKRAALNTLEALQGTLGDLNDIAVGAHMDGSSAADTTYQDRLSRFDSLRASAEAQYLELARLEPFW